MSVVSLESDEVAAAGQCRQAPEAFNPEGRRLVGRVCRAFLDQNTLTSSELFSRVDMQQRMSNNAQDLQRAVQLLAGAQARSFTTDLHKRMRILFKLQDTIAQTVGDLEPVVENVVIGPGQLGPAMQGLKKSPGGPKGSIAAVMVVGLYLKERETWEAKFESLLELMESETDPDALTMLDSYLGDVIDSPAALKAIFGQVSTMGERITELIWLHKGIWPPKEIEEPSPLLGRLNTLLGQHPMPHTRLSLELQIVRALQGGLPVTKGAGADELLMLCDFFAQLDVEDVGTAALMGEQPTEKDAPNPYDRIIGGYKVVKALEVRMSRQVEHENLVFLLEDKANVIEKVMTLLELQLRTVGVANKKQIGEFLRIQFERRDFPILLLEAGDTPTQKLKVIADLYDRVIASELQGSLRERIAAQLEDIQMKFIKDNKVFARIAQQAGNTADTVLKLADLCAKGLFTGGKNTVYVHSLIKHQIGTGTFMKAYLQGAEGAQKEAKLLELRKRLAAAGIEGEAA